MTETLRPSLVSDLLLVSAYPEATSTVEFLETHISWIFFAGERVYKVKKPVDLGFLDFTTLALRKHFCEEEVRLNSRLSPDMYFGVVPITKDPEGHAVIRGEGEAVEWAVEMKRLPAYDMLEQVLERGEVDNRLMNLLVGTLLRFHQQAQTGPGVDEFGSHEAILGNVQENFEQLRALGPKLEHDSWQASIDFLESRQLAFLEQHRELFERRIVEGRIRDGHGDLHAGNICVSKDQLQIYDCIEFSDRFRCGDVACDLAFLAMDLDHHEAPAFSSYLVHRYAREAGDPGVEVLMDFYKEYRALVRCKVAAFTATDERVSDELAQAKRVEALRFLNLAVSYEMPPTLVLMCGLPASGKSWLAKRLARTLRGVFLQSDVRRKILAGIVPTARARTEIDTGLYAPEMKNKTYRFLLKHAVDVLLAGKTVFVDATFSKSEYRRPFLDAAARLGLPHFVVHVTAPEDVTRERMEKRKTDHREASDANFEVYLKARESFEPPSEVQGDRVLQLDSSVISADEAAAQLLERMIAEARSESLPER